MLSYELNMEALWQLEPELWPIMWFWRHLWRHCDVQWRRTAKKSIPLKSVDQDLWFDILLDYVGKSSIFSKTLTWPNFSRSRSKVKFKVRQDGPRHVLSYKLSLKSLKQLKPKLWPFMWFSHFPWPWPWPLTLTSHIRTCASDSGAWSFGAIWSISDKNCSLESANRQTNTQTHKHTNTQTSGHRPHVVELTNCLWCLGRGQGHI